GFAPVWKGPRLLGGYQTEGERVTRLALAHGNPYDEEGPELHVESAVRLDESLELVKRNLFEGLMMTARRSPPDLSPDEFSRWVLRADREVHGVPDPEWFPLTIPVDTHLVDF